MLASATDQYRIQQRVTALGLREGRRVATRGSLAVAAVVARYQLLAIATTLGAMPDVLSEQNLDAPPVAGVQSAALLTGSATATMLDNAQTDASFDLLVSTLIQDAGRTAAAVDIARRPIINGYVRSLNPPSCGRCAVLAGRVYRYSTGFQRHPKCDCLMTPTNDAEGLGLITDPSTLAPEGKIRGLSKADQFALDNGADLSQVVNVRRKEAGLTVGSSVLARGDRLTPQGILSVAPTRERAIEMLRHDGYLL